MKTIIAIFFLLIVLIAFAKLQYHLAKQINKDLDEQEQDQNELNERPNK